MRSATLRKIGWKIEFGKNRARAIFKDLLVVLNIQVLLRPLISPFYRAYWLVSFLGWVARHQSRVIGKIDTNRETFYQALNTQLALSLQPVLFLEFGVFRGESIRWWSKGLPHPESRLWGFDTFTGLPEDWGSAPKGFFSTGGKIPQIEDSRVNFYKGLFQESLPPLLDQVRTERPRKRFVIHLDADLYGSTLFVLLTLAPYLRPDDVIVFDEFCFVTHEYRAYVNFLESWSIHLELERATTGFLQTAFRVSTPG